MEETNKTKSYILPLVLILIMLAASAVIFWGFDRAFDFTDAGFYLLRYQEQQPLDPGSFGFDHALIKAIFPPALRQVIPLRIASFVLNLLGILWLSYALFRWLRKGCNSDKRFVMVLWILFSAFIFAIPGSPPELCYNSLNQFFIACSLGFLLLSFSHEGWCKNLLALGAGLFCGTCIATKLPSALALGVSSFVLLGLINKSPKRSLISYMGGAILSLLVLLLLIEPNIISYYYSGYKLISKGNQYGSGLLIDSVFDAIKQNIAMLLRAIAINLILFLGDRTPKRYWRISLYVLGIVGIVAVCKKPFIKQFGGGMLNADFLMLWIYLIVLRLSVINFSGWSVLRKWLGDNRQQVIIILFMLAVPYMGALGTNNSLNWGAKFYYFSFMGAFLAINALCKCIRVRVAIYVLAGYMLLLGLYHYVQYPYRSKPLYLNKYAYQNIKYDKQKAVFLHRTEATLHELGFNPEQGIIAAYKLPGLVYLMHSYHPGGVLWSEETEDLYFRILSVSKFTQKPLLLCAGNEPSAMFIAKLNSALKIDFHKDYQLKAAYPYFESGLQVYVYCPIAL